MIEHLLVLVLCCILNLFLKFQHQTLEGFSFIMGNLADEICSSVSELKVSDPSIVRRTEVRRSISQR